MTPPIACHGALALELSPGTHAGHVLLTAETAGALATLVSRDLARLVPEAAELDLALLAGLFDPVELLRPGWPLHRELERLVAQAPGAGARVIAFGGDMPTELQPDPSHAEGPLRLLPFVLRGDAAIAAGVGEQLEAILLDTGMAGAETALFAQQSFGATIEHARYLTVHDLAAMIAMQYDHVGLGGLWPLLETALLAPEDDCWLDAPPEPLVRLSGGHARIAMLDDQAWVGQLPTDERAADPARLERGYLLFQMRQRQIAALLEAHGIPATFDHCPPGQDPRALLSG